MANDFKYLHPSVQTSINSYQNVFQPQTGVMTLFQADTFEKGKDGVIDFVGSEEEFLFKYGTPNYDKYGQTGYNIVNWLRSGGQALVLRVLPEDATYAHSILNVQSKVTKDGKSVLNQNGDVVKIDDVELRPTIAFLKKNNRHIDELVNELEVARDGETTVDGYDNNFLLLVNPKGRGESYNNIGFRLSLNTSMDTSQRNRVYDFEVIEFDEFSNVNVVEGPFQVSFDPDAESNFGESMYIDEVIKRHSNYVESKFNLENFERLASLINPNVHPASIDVLSGSSKVGIDGSAETYYASETGKPEDTHIALQKYNSNGELITQNGNAVLNLADANDSVQNALISLDNDMRENEYLVESNKLDRMREQFKALRSDGHSDFNLILNESVTLGGESNEELTGGELFDISTVELDEVAEGSAYGTFKDSITNYEETPSEENLSRFLSASNALSRLLKNDVVAQGTELSAAHDLVRRSTADNTINPKYQSDMDRLMQYLNDRDQVSIFATEHKSKIFDITRDISAYRIGVASGSSLEGVSLILNNLEAEIEYVYENLLPVAYGSYENVPSEVMNLFDKDIEGTIYANYIENITLLSDMRSGLAEDNAANREEVFASSQEDANRLVDVINQAVFGSSETNMTGAVEFTKNNVIPNIVSFRISVEDMIVTDSSYTERDVLENARNNVELAVSQVARTGSKYFNTNLIESNNPIKFLFGSDGSFSYNSDISRKERRANVKSELVKAYNGLVDADVLNIKKYPFDVVLDARYPNEVKNAISNLAKNNRKDFLFFADTATDVRYPVGPEDAIRWRREEFPNSSEYTSIFSQDLVFYDEFTSRDIRMTPTYVLASKIPAQAVNSGLHLPLAGPRRGLIDGHKALSWSPDAAYREKLYVSKVNYIEQETNRTKFGSQQTSISSDGPLSNINNMFTLVSIKRDVEDLVANYQFEFNDDETRNIMYTELNSYLDKYVSNRSCESVIADVSSSEYDKQRRIVRVKISVKFNNVIERIYIDIDVEK